jgi:eukaryotic-like serine/threonine-protein kinase
LIGQTISHYRIVEKLGSGGMGVVYKAQDTRLGRQVALKFLPDELTADRQALERFQREARAASALDHPNICVVYELGEHDGRPFIAMQCLEGETLTQRLAGKPLSLERLLDFTLQAAEGLEAAHAAGIVHRDLKPSNLFVTVRGHIKILDFGVAKLVEARRAEADAATAADPAPQTLTIPGAALGTPAYMSPEQALAHPVEASSDIFSFGAVVYEMATGQRAFTGATAPALFDAILHRAPRPFAELGVELPAALEAVIFRTLEKDPAARYPSAAEFVADWKRLKRGLESGVALPDTPPTPTTSSLRAVSSLAVLPFENQGGDPETEYLSDGLAESIIAKLSQLPDLRVVARSSASRFKGRQIDARDAGRSLGVSAVLTGRILQVGDRLAVAAELVDVATGWQIWGERYRRALTDVFALEDELAREISANLRRQLAPAGESPARRPTEDLEAYQLYLKARHFWAKRTAEALQKAIDFFQQALDRDPNFALAYLGLADCYIPLGYHGFLAPRDAFPRARAAAEKARELDPQLAQVQTILGAIEHVYEWNHAAALETLRAAAQAAPNDPRAHQAYAECLVMQGRFDEGEREALRALELDPLSVALNLIRAYPFYFSRRFDTAAALCRTAIDLDPKSHLPHWFLALCCEEQGQFDEAIAELEKACELAPATLFVSATLAGTYARASRASQARRLLAELEVLRQRKYVSGVPLAVACAALGENDRAWQWLERAEADRCVRLSWIKVDPRLDPFRGDPRFAALAARIGLPS